MDDQDEMTEIPPNRQRRRSTDLSWYERHRGGMRLLLGGGLLTMIVLYTSLVRDYTLSNKALADVVALAAIHDGILKQKEVDARTVAVLQAQRDADERETDRRLLALEKRDEHHDMQLRAIEQRMFDRIRKDPS